jgi:predicted nucleic acid-binding protein
VRLLDANVFIYAVGRRHPYQQPCVRLLAEAEENTGQYNVSVEVLQEVLHVFWARQQLRDGLRAFDQMMKMFPDAFPVERKDSLLARALLQHHPALSPRDAIHAATVLNHDLEAIISADRAFDQISEIKRLDPLELYP